MANISSRMAPIALNMVLTDSTPSNHRLNLLLIFLINPLERKRALSRKFLGEPDESQVFCEVFLQGVFMLMCQIFDVIFLTRQDFDAKFLTCHDFDSS